MPDQASPTPPPGGSTEKAQKYIDWLVKLIDSNKLTAAQSNLSKFNISDMEDHYRISLKDYEIEVSHSKNPESGQDLYIMLFNNLSLIGEHCQRVILAYIHLTAEQFNQFKRSAQGQIDRAKQLEEDKRFTQTMTQVDQELENLVNEPQPVPEPTPAPEPVATEPLSEATSPSLTPMIKPPLPEDTGITQTTPTLPTEPQTPPTDQPNVLV